MQTLKSSVLLSLLIALMVGTPAMAQPQISGPQSGTLGPGTYLVVGNIRVITDETLTIVPGTTFLHNGNWIWEISGQLNAEGAEGDSIYFVRQNPINDHRWGGIRFQEGASSNGTIDYCVIDYCYHGIQPYYTYGGGIYTNTADITITNSRISNCSNYWDGGGIYAESADVVIENCLIVDNTAASGSNGGGILLNNCDAAQVLNCEIARNSATGT